MIIESRSRRLDANLQLTITINMKHLNIIKAFFCRRPNAQKSEIIFHITLRSMHYQCVTFCKETVFGEFLKYYNKLFLKTHSIFLLNTNITCLDKLEAVISIGYE